MPSVVGTAHPMAQKFAGQIPIWIGVFNDQHYGTTSPPTTRARTTSVTSNVKSIALLVKARGTSTHFQRRKLSLLRPMTKN